MVIDVSFPCIKCGACCRIVSCQFLTPDNLCSIYERRPLSCNVDKLYDFRYSDILTREEFYHLNSRFCQKLRSVENDC